MLAARTTIVVLLSAAVALAATAGGATAGTSFSNTSAITIPASGTSGVATPYPSTIPVAGLTGQITDVNVTLHDFTHTFTHDVTCSWSIKAGSRRSS